MSPTRCAVVLVERSIVRLGRVRSALAAAALVEEHHSVAIGVEPAAKARRAYRCPGRRAAPRRACRQGCRRCSTRSDARLRRRACPRRTARGEGTSQPRPCQIYRGRAGPGGGTGRRRGLKPLGSRWGRAGSIPAPGTTRHAFGATIVQVPWASATSLPSFSISMRTTAIRLVMATISLVAVHTPLVTGASRLILNSVVAAQ